jgi:hypothetical protein
MRLMGISRNAFRGVVRPNYRESIKMKLKSIGSNQTELENNGIAVLFSYSTPVAALLPSGRYVKTSTKYSVTTTKHVNKWLVGVMADVEVVPQDFINNLANGVTV